MPRAIDARALLDGRIPAEWKHGDRVPENALADSPLSHYASDYASFQLCTCKINYFALGMPLRADAPTMRKLS